MQRAITCHILRCQQRPDVVDAFYTLVREIQHWVSPREDHGREREGGREGTERERERGGGKGSRNGVLSRNMHVQHFTDSLLYTYTCTVTHTPVVVTTERDKKRRGNRKKEEKGMQDPLIIEHTTQGEGEREREPCFSTGTYMKRPQFVLHEPSFGRTPNCRYIYMHAIRARASLSTGARSLFMRAYSACGLLVHWNLELDPDCHYFLSWSRVQMRMRIKISAFPRWQKNPLLYLMQNPCYYPSLIRK